jgi:hypothetical protein
MAPTESPDHSRVIRLGFPAASPDAVVVCEWGSYGHTMHGI